MTENKIYYQVTARKFEDDHNISTIYTFNCGDEAYKKFYHCADVYDNLTPEQRGRVAVELHIIDRTVSGVRNVIPVAMIGYGLYDDRPQTNTKPV